MKRFMQFLISFLLLVPPLIFFTDLTRNPYYFQITLLNCLVLLAVAAGGIEAVRKKELRLQGTPLDLPLAGFVAVATLSWIVALAVNSGHPYLFTSVYSEGMKHWLFLVVNAVLAYYLAVNLTTDENRNRFLQCVFAAAFLASVYGILQYFGIEFFWPNVLNPYGGRSVSTFGNPNFLSSYLVLTIPPAYIFYVKSRGSGRFLYFILLITCFAALLCTLTRSSLAGLFFALLLTAALLWKHDRERLTGQWKKLILLPFGLMLFLTFAWPKSSIGGYSPTVIDRIKETAQAEKTYYGSWHQRRLIWSCAWHMVAEKPVLGKGWGCFELFFPFYQGRHLFLEPYRTFRTHANNAHNEVLEIWSQTGTLGLGIYLWLLVCIIAYSRSLLRHPDREKGLIAIGLCAGLAGMGVDNLLNVSLHFAIPGFLAWWFLGTLVGLGNGEAKSIPLRSPAAKALVWLGVALCALGIGSFTTDLRGEINYFNGFKLSKANQPMQALPYLETAHRLQRFEVNNNYELANCYARVGMREQAIEGYKEALRANAGYDEIYFNMGTVLMQAGLVDAAVEEYTRALYINPLAFDAYGALGNVFLRNPGLYGDAALSLYRQLVSLSPENKEAWNNLGYLLMGAGKHEEALSAFRSALEIDPDFAVARKNYRDELARSGKTDRSLEEMDARFQALQRQVMARNWEEALRLSEALVKDFPRSSKARFYLANVCYTLGKPAAAIEQYTAALKLGANDVATHGNLGLAYMDTKQYALARAQFQKLLQLNPQDQMATRKLAEIDQLQNLSR